MMNGCGSICSLSAFATIRHSFQSRLRCMAPGTTHLSPFGCHRSCSKFHPQCTALDPIRIPYGGGFYFRALPLWLTRTLLRCDLKSGRTPLLYFHPWEFEHAPAGMEDRWSYRFIANYQLETAWKKFEALMDGQPTQTIASRYALVCGQGRRTDAVCTSFPTEYSEPSTAPRAV